MDESRFGLLSNMRRCLTAKGIKPIVPYQHKFQNFYLFGAYSPVNGDSFTLEYPYCNTDCFQSYLDHMSAYNKDEFKILLLDNGAFHRSKQLKIPSNIYLFFIPPYSPELNPAECIWRHIKTYTANKVFSSLEELSQKVSNIVKQMNNKMIQSITGWTIYKKCIY